MAWGFLRRLISKSLFSVNRYNQRTYFWGQCFYEDFVIWRC